MNIEKIVNPVAQENTYLLLSATSTVILDPGSEPERLLAKIQLWGRPVKGILLSHAHFDHIMGLEKIKAAYPQAPIFLHENEKDWPKSPELNASRLMLGSDVLAPEADRFYPMDPDAELALGDLTFRVLETPGHSIGGVSLVFDDDKLVFTGDALFAGAVGRWDLPTGNFDQLMQSLRTKLLPLPDDYQVLPGHGPATTIGHERQFNPYLQG